MYHSGLGITSLLGLDTHTPLLTHLYTPCHALPHTPSHPSHTHTPRTPAPHTVGLGTNTLSFGTEQTLLPLFQAVLLALLLWIIKPLSFRLGSTWILIE